jgi:hypothetical protein
LNIAVISPLIAYCCAGFCQVLLPTKPLNANPSDLLIRLIIDLFDRLLFWVEYYLFINPNTADSPDCKSIRVRDGRPIVAVNLLVD